MSLVPTNVRVTIVRMSSLPLPQRIQSGSTPSSSPARMRNAVASGSGYFCKPGLHDATDRRLHLRRTLVRILVRVELDELLALRLLAGDVAVHFGDVGADLKGMGSGESVRSRAVRVRVHVELRYFDACATLARVGGEAFAFGHADDVVGDGVRGLPA